MTVEIEKTISSFVKGQFPAFYESEGPVFQLFLEAYYEWLEQDGNAVGEARNLFNYRDIDYTLEDFKEHFQKKYLHSIPYNIISDKRLLLKHILDIYRSKGTARGYELLFKLIYNQDVEIYDPKYDILKVSDGTWIEPRFLEVTDGDILPDLVGKTIIGSQSNTVAMVEKYVSEPINNNLVSTLYISNISPQGANFEVGEKILNYANTNEYSLFDAPTIIGSLDYIQIINGGDGFNVGDILKVAERDFDTNEKVSFGRDAKIKVTDTSRSQGALQFFINHEGFGYTQNTSVYFYKGVGDNSGYGASFQIGPISYITNLSYNSDLIVDYENTVFNSVAYNFPLNPVANSASPIYSMFTFNNNNFGSIYKLSRINPGNNYIYAPNIFVRSSLHSNNIPVGTISYSNSNIFVYTPGEMSYDTTNNIITSNGSFFTTIFSNGDVIGLQSANVVGAEEYHVIVSVDSNTQLTLDSPPNNNSTVYSHYYKIPYVSGTSTDFTKYFVNNDVIGLQADSSNSNTLEYQVIKEVVNTTLLIMYDSPVNNATPSAEYRIAPPIMPANYALYESIMVRSDKTIPGINASIGALPNNGNNIVSAAVAYNSGKGYIDGEQIEAYLYGVLNTPIVLTSGNGYSNGEQLIFNGGTTSIAANGFISTNPYGEVVRTTLLDPGAGYSQVPIITVASNTGNGATFSTTIAPDTVLNPYSQVIGKIVKAGIGKEPGYWSTTRGFLNSDKYIQDSYYYQDYSYEIRVSNTLDKYINIIYDAFHTSGMELFGQYLYKDKIGLVTEIVFERDRAVLIINVTCDSDEQTCDNYLITCDTGQ